ncbi:hypothetical protein OESDEN_18322 [Oesophagostomum dentatum]|uniref:Uncharacterized protein n=1 Tax=Oesophagostomum dentatum TaxID=61180 RepID=A0A0B1SEM2_OESDE|nr:hypothetical protein OESDEN_18322 [Oesophagostomum dentatum]
MQNRLDLMKTAYSKADAVAQKFKEGGGVIITMEYGQKSCKIRSTLGTLATDPSYAFSTCEGPLKAQNIRKAFCKGWFKVQ